jgi:hypothetical protein
MRALCGSIITAGALLALGLTIIGIGMRYSNLHSLDSSGNIVWVRFRDLDTSLMVALVVCLLMILVGIVTAFAGLAFHHERRHREWLHLHGNAPQHRPTVPTTP